MREKVFFIFIFFMFLILTGCSEKENNRQIDLLYSNGNYIYDEVEMPADYLAENMCVHSENVYFIGTDQKKNGKKILVVKNKNGEMEIKEEIELDGFCRGEIEAFYKKEQGGYFALLKNNTGYEIMEMDEGGIITEEIELDTKGTDTLSMAQFDEDGNLYAGTYTEEFWNIVWFRKDGTLSAEAELSDGAYLCSVLVKGDKLYCTYYGIEKNIIIYEYQLEDLQNGKGKMSSVETYDTGVTAHGKAELILSEDIAYDFYVNDFSNVYAYSIVDKSSKKILNWTNTGLDGRSSEKVFSVSEESLLAFYKEDKGKQKICHMKKGENEKEELTAAILFSDSEFEKKILEFNQKSEGIRIVLKDYSAMEDPVQAMHKDILSDHVPDIISVSNLDWENYVQKGLLTDLTEFIEKDSEISEQDFSEHMIKLLKKDGKIYFIPDVFSVDVLVGASETIQQNEEWNLEEWVRNYQQLGEEKILIGGLKRNAILKKLCLAELDEWVDMDTGNVDFYGSSLEKILKFSKEVQEDDTQTGYETMEELRKGNVLFTSIQMSDFDNYSLYKTLYHDMEIKGYPRMQGSSICAEIEYRPLLAITSTCKQKEAAFEFLKEFWTYEHQKSEMAFGFPTRKDVLAMKMEHACAKQPYTDKDGEYVNAAHTFGICDVMITVKALEDRDVNNITNMLYQVDQIRYSNSSREKVVAIIEEEAELYFDGEKSLKETIDMIQSRVKIFVNEKKG